MEAKISKAQLDVWEWKERAYNEIKDMPLLEALKKIREETRPIIDELKRKRQNSEKHTS